MKATSMSPSSFIVMSSIDVDRSSSLTTSMHHLVHHLHLGHEVAQQARRGLETWPAAPFPGLAAALPAGYLLSYPGEEKQTRAQQTAGG
jgi:hypothetical protein